MESPSSAYIRTPALSRSSPAVVLSFPPPLPSQSPARLSPASSLAPTSPYVRSVQDLPINPRSWRPAHVAIYISHVLRTSPPSVVSDAVEYVHSSNLSGREFLKLSDDALDQNAPWTPHFAAARIALLRECLRHGIYTSGQEALYESDVEKKPPPIALFQNFDINDALSDDGASDRSAALSPHKSPLRSSLSYPHSLSPAAFTPGGHVKGMARKFDPTSSDSVEIPKLSTPQNVSSPKGCTPKSLSPFHGSTPVLRNFNWGQMNPVSPNPTSSPPAGTLADSPSIQYSRNHPPSLPLNKKEGDEEEDRPPYTGIRDLFALDEKESREFQSPVSDSNKEYDMSSPLDKRGIPDSFFGLYRDLKAHANSPSLVLIPKDRLRELELRITELEAKLDHFSQTGSIASPSLAENDLNRWITRHSHSEDECSEDIETTTFFERQAHHFIPDLSTWSGFGTYVLMAGIGVGVVAGEAIVSRLSRRV